MARLFFSAGEPSGDIHTANLLRALQQRREGTTAVGFGGPRMRSAGCEILYPLADQAIMGLAGALKSLPVMRRLLTRFEEELIHRRPDAVVLVDYPGFHLRLASLAHRRGVPVFYHVPPQIWAWGSWRVRKIAETVDYLFCSLPFEEAWYRSHGIANARYVGHPFFDDLAECQPRQACTGEMGPGRKRLLLLPGSRLWEARRNLSHMLEAAANLHKRVDGLEIHVAAFHDAIADEVRRRLQPRHGDVSIHVGRTRELLSIADAAIAVSGSVSLELLHFQVPSVVVYSVPWHWQYVLKPLLLHSPHVSLVNLLAGKRVFPEFVGSGVRGRDVARAVEPLLVERRERERVRRTLGMLRGAYGQSGASATAASILLERLGIERSRKSA